MDKWRFMTEVRTANPGQSPEWNPKTSWLSSVLFHYHPTELHVALCLLHGVGGGRSSGFCTAVGRQEAAGHGNDWQSFRRV